MTEPAIRTEVVGSYPTPAWLTAMPSRPALRDALLVVLKTQELAGLDVVSDGELARFDVNHPDTNGMIESRPRRCVAMRATIARAVADRTRL